MIKSDGVSLFSNKNLVTLSAPLILAILFSNRGPWNEPNQHLFFLEAQVSLETQVRL